MSKQTANNATDRTPGERPGVGLTAKARRVLAALAKAKGPLTRADLGDALAPHNNGNPVRKGWSLLLGSHTVETGGQSGGNGLCDRGLVAYERDGASFRYVITAKGRKALAKAGGADKPGKVDAKPASKATGDKPKATRKPRKATVEATVEATATEQPAGK